MTTTFISELLIVFKKKDGTTNPNFLDSSQRIWNQITNKMEAFRLEEGAWCKFVLW